MSFIQFANLVGRGYCKGSHPADHVCYVECRSSFERNVPTLEKLTLRPHLPCRPVVRVGRYSLHVHTVCPSVFTFCVHPITTGCGTIQLYPMSSPFRAADSAIARNGNASCNPINSHHSLENPEPLDHVRKACLRWRANVAEELRALAAEKGGKIVRCRVGEGGGGGTSAGDGSGKGRGQTGSFPGEQEGL